MQIDWFYWVVYDVVDDVEELGEFQKVVIVSLVVGLLFVVLVDGIGGVGDVGKCDVVVVYDQIVCGIVGMDGELCRCQCNQFFDYGVVYLDFV